MPKFTNTSAISLPLAVMLASDFYDHDPDPKAISATGILKPLKQIILSNRLTGTGQADLESQIPSVMGNALHSLLEKSWLENYGQAMIDLGYPEKIIGKVCINPTASEILAFKHQFGVEALPIYMEQRVKKEFNGWWITGAFDFVVESKVYDLKSTSCYGYMVGNKVPDYIKQMSIYKWLNPDKITNEHGTIMYWFTDWSKLDAIKNPDYPQNRLLEKSYPLMSDTQVETYLTQKLSQLVALMDEPQSTMPNCTDDELWMKPPVFAYYKNKAKTSGRSSKNYKTLLEAKQRHSEDGFVGTVIERKAQAKACLWCPALSICDQAKDLIGQGLLTV